MIDLSGQRILVTQAKDFMGPALCHELRVCGAEVIADERLLTHPLDAQAVMDKMESAGNGTNIVILDACRNNPFARSFRSSTQGLAQMDAPVGTLVAKLDAAGNTLWQDTVSTVPAQVRELALDAERALPDLDRERLGQLLGSQGAAAHQRIAEMARAMGGGLRVLQQLPELVRHPGPGIGRAGRDRSGSIGRKV